VSDIWRDELDSVISAEVEGPNLVVIRRRKSMARFANGDSMPDRVWKEIYSSGLGGQIVLSKTIEGRHIPPSRLTERIEFPE